MNISFILFPKKEYKLDRYQREKQKKINTELNNHNKKNYVVVWLETKNKNKEEEWTKIKVRWKIFQLKVNPKSQITLEIK